MTGHYDVTFVVLSVLIAILSAYAALDLAGRVTFSRRRRLAWLSGGASAMGIGIWSMHYIGMLAFRMPMPVLYDWPTVLLSFPAAMLASALALFVVSRKTMGFAATFSAASSWAVASLPCTTSAWPPCACRPSRCTPRHW